MEDPVFFNLVIKMHEKHRTCQVGVYNDFSRYLNWNLKLLFFSSYEEISHRYFSKIFSSIKILIKMKVIFEKKSSTKFFQSQHRQFSFGSTYYEL